MRYTALNPKTAIVAFLTATLFSADAIGQSVDALEFAPGVGNPTGNGPSIANQVITLQRNTNNPTGNSFSTYNPTLTATFSISNQQYTLPVSQISTGKGLSFGGTNNNSGVLANGSPLFPAMNYISTPANGNFTSTTAVTPGQGIDITANNGVGVFASVKALQNAGLSTGGRYYYGDLTITFNQTITNPIIHVVGIGGFVGSLGFTAELELQTPGISLSKVSGSSELNIVSGTKILNTALHPGSTTGSGAASGSVLATGSGISSLTFKIYMRGDGNGANWSNAGDHQGDVFIIGTSFTAPVDISGNVFDDAKGLTDGKVDGPGIGAANGSQLYANLLNTAGTVLNTVAVGADGKYTFSHVASFTNYTIQLSTTQGAKATPAPVTALPVNWSNTGEFFGNGSGSDGTPNGRLDLTVFNSNLTNANFAIEEAPDSDPKWYGIPTPAVNSSMLLVGLGTIPGPLSGDDSEDGILGAAKKVGITSLPSGGNQLWYNGVQITKGADNVNAPSTTNPFIISSYVLNILAVKFTGIGANQTVFNYAYYDAAGVMDGTPATYTINWASILPVKLISFSATLTDNNVDLKWTVTAENNLSHYAVEKSTDGKNFSQAGVVFASGSTTEKIDYTFTDNNVTSETNSIYYRLRSVSKDGKSELSETRIIRLEKQIAQVSITAYPNPVSSELRITVPANWQGKKVSFEVFGNNGQIVTKNETSHSSQTETINVSKLTPGFYIIRVACDNDIAQQKIIKQ